MSNNAGNVEPRDIYPDYAAPIVRTDANGDRELALARWGMPSPRIMQMEKTGKRVDKLRAKASKSMTWPFVDCLSLSPTAASLTCATPPAVTGSPGSRPPTAAWCRLHRSASQGGMLRALTNRFGSHCPGMNPWSSSLASICATIVASGR